MNEQIKDSSGIYYIINLVNNKKYIGSAINLRVRRNQHFSLLRRSKHRNQYLQHAYDKYGYSSFQFIVLEELCQPELLIEREQYYLEYFNSFDPKFGYNIREKAGSQLGFKHSEETRRKIGELGKGRKISQETRNKMGEARRGHKHSDETKEKIRISKLGKPNYKPTPEIKAKISAALQGREVTSETRLKISEKHKGKTLTFEHRQKLSLAHRGKKISEKTKQKMGLSGSSNPFYGHLWTKEERQNLSKKIRSFWMEKRKQERSKSPQLLLFDLD